MNWLWHIINLNEDRSYQLKKNFKLNIKHLRFSEKNIKNKKQFNPDYS